MGKLFGTKEGKAIFSLRSVDATAWIRDFDEQRVFREASEIVKRVNSKNFNRWGPLDRWGPYDETESEEADVDNEHITKCQRLKINTNDAANVFCGHKLFSDEIEKQIKKNLNTVLWQDYSPVDPGVARNTDRVDQFIRIVAINRKDEPQKALFQVGSNETTKVFATSTDVKSIDRKLLKYANRFMKPYRDYLRNWGVVLPEYDMIQMNAHHLNKNKKVEGRVRHTPRHRSIYNRRRPSRLQE